MSELIQSVPVSPRKSLVTKPEPIFFNDRGHHFEAIPGLDLDQAARGFNSPISVILQITRKCNFDCSFCSEIVRIDDPTFKQDRYELSLLEQDLTFGFHLYYIESEEECQQLCQHADRLVALALSEQNVIVGHQFSSDMSVLLACADGSLPAIEALQYAWRTRNQSLERSTVKVFDTRYDLGTPKEESHRLVDVCNTWNLAVMQPEIAGSMTKMQRDFYSNQSSLILEKIAVLNLRHSLSSILLYLFHLYGRPALPMNINEILYRNLADKFDYVGSARFRALLTDKEELYPQSAKI